MEQAFRAAAEGGNADAMLDWGRCVWDGWEVPGDPGRANAVYRRTGEVGCDVDALLENQGLGRP